MAIENWSTTAASNNSASPDGFPENMAPSGVNDSAREVMAQVRRWAQQAVSHIYAADTGAADAYAIAPAIAPAAYTAGSVYTFVAANTNTGASTLNVSTLGALAIQKLGAALVAGDITAGDVVEVRHDGTQFQMISPHRAKSGGTIDNAVIGGTTAAAGTFTTLTANTSVLPDADDGAPLGASGTAFSDLFLASGGVINFNAGDVTLTHLSNVLSVGGGALMVGDTSNANNTSGLTVNHGTSSTHLFTGKASNVSTGLTTVPIGAVDVEGDDFIVIMQETGTKGGMRMLILSETGEAFPGFFESYGGAPQITDTTSSLGAINFFVAEHDGANGLNDMAADSNAFAWGEITSAGSRLTRMLLKADDGELHLGNTTLVALDHEDDIAAIRSLQRVTTNGRGIIESPLENESPAYSHADLQRLGFVGPKDENGDFLIRVQPILGGLMGATWQLYERQQAICAMVEEFLPGFASRLEDRLHGRTQTLA